MSGGAIRVRALDFRRPGGFALSLPALDLPAGGKLACIGPSGSGKSTLLQLLSGLLTPRAGSVHVAGVELASAPDAERRRFRLTRVGLVFQELELLEHLGVRDNALLPWLLVPSVDLGRRERALERLARDVGIEHLLARLPRSLSQGEKQRVAVCRALLGSPRLVLADEPTGNLDADTSARVVDVILREVEALGATLVFVTHDHRLLPRFDDVLDLGAGEEKR